MTGCGNLLSHGGGSGRWWEVGGGLKWAIEERDLVGWVEGGLYIENSIFGYGGIPGQCVTRPCKSGKNVELILLRNGKFYSLD
jgi:hypothetical protein